MKRNFKYRINRLGSKVLTGINVACLIFMLVCIVSIAIVCVSILINGFWFQVDEDGIKGMVEFWRDYALIIKTFLLSATLFVANYNLKKYIDGENVKCLSAIREKLNTPAKQAIHAYLLDRSDKQIGVLSGKHVQEEVLDVEEFQFATNEAKVNDIARENIELFDYLGTIELAGIMVQRGLITIEEFDCQFGYRLDNCLSNKDIISHIYEQGNNYDDLNFIIELHNKNSSWKL